VNQGLDNPDSPCPEGTFRVTAPNARIPDPRIQAKLDSTSLYLWGVQLPGGALGFEPDGNPHITSSSAERIVDLFGMLRDLELFWLDA
jgi:hypothetical protein